MNLQFLFSRFIEKGLRNCRLYTRNPLLRGHAIYRQWTKLFARFQFTLYISKYYLEINSRLILIIILSRIAERYVVYSSNFEITFSSMFFKSQ